MAIGEEGNGQPPHRILFPRKNSEPCLWFLLRSKPSMLCNSMKILLARKATGNHLMNSTSLEKTQSPVSGFCYTRNRVCNAKNALMRSRGVGCLSRRLLVLQQAPPTARPPCSVLKVLKLLTAGSGNTAYNYNLILDNDYLPVLIESR